MLSVLGLIPLLAFLALGVLWLTVPPDSQTVRIPGLSAPVDISIDGNGVPRIRAANERDAATALGYVHARDRMFQMELMRRAASGRLAELVGPAALPIDKQMRVFGLARLAEGDVAAQSPDARAMLEAYAAGVNAWIGRRGRFAALECLFFGAPEPWRPADSLLWGRTMSLWLSSNYRTELARQALRDKVPPHLLEQLWPPHPPPLPPQASLEATHPPVLNTRHPALDARHPPARPGDQPPRNVAAGDPPDALLTAAKASAVLAALPAFPAPFTLPSSASDAWAVDGRWTDTGAPLLAGDPHLSFDFPGLWYLVRIDTPNHELVGATGPGVPFLVMGHNGRIAWTFTTTGADTQDVYLEPSDVAFITRQERIKVRGQPDTVLTVRETRHGPVISDLTPGNGPILAVAMTNLLPRDPGATGLLALNRARTVEEAGKAAPLFGGSVQNLMVADGTKIGLFVTGHVPIRRAGDGWAPVPGKSAAGSTPPGQVPAESEQGPTGQITPPESTPDQASPVRGSAAPGPSAKNPPAQIPSQRSTTEPATPGPPAPISSVHDPAEPITLGELPPEPAPSGQSWTSQTTLGELPPDATPPSRSVTGPTTSHLLPPAAAPPVRDSPTRFPSAQIPSGQAPSGQTPSGQTPSGQTPSHQAPLAQTSSESASPIEDTPHRAASAQLPPAQNGAAPTGDDDPYGWIGFASGEALPHIVAPASGRLVNANEPVAPPNFPVFMGRDTFRDWRARRIRTLLDSMPKHSTSDFAAMQTDVVSTYAIALLPTLRVVPGAPQVLRDWDGAMTETAPQPLIFAAWMDAFHRAVLARVKIPVWAGAPVFEFVPFVLSPDGASWCGGDCAPLLKATLDSTMASLAARFGADPSAWRWGTVHQAVFAHPLLRSIPVLGALSTSRIAVPGDGATLDRGGTNEALESVHGASFRGVYDLADLDRSLFMMTPGQSGNPLSRHARDFLTRWRDGAMVLLASRPVETSGVIRLQP